MLSLIKSHKTTLTWGLVSAVLFLVILLIWLPFYSFLFVNRAGIKGFFDQQFLLSMRTFPAFGKAVFIIPWLLSALFFLFLLFFLGRLIFKSKSQPGKWLRIGLFHLFIYAFMLCTVESILRRDNYHFPGSLFPGFKMVDKLVNVQIHQCDSLGINRNDPHYSAWEAMGYTINEDGFRSPYKFQKSFLDSLKVSKNKPVIAIIGDSYVEGIGADKIQECFADILHEDFIILNFGLGGSDPLQYELIAKQYIPELLPDLVVTVVYAGNDIFPYRRIPNPGTPLYYQTNAGWLSSVMPPCFGGKPGEIFLTSQNAYNFYEDRLIPFG